MPAGFLVVCLLDVVLVCCLVDLFGWVGFSGACWWCVVNSVACVLFLRSLCFVFFGCMLLLFNVVCYLVWLMFVVLIVCL